MLRTQAYEGDDLYLLLDGVLEKEVDAEVLAQLGQGVIVGERAILGGVLERSVVAGGS